MLSFFLVLFSDRGKTVKALKDTSGLDTSSLHIKDYINVMHSGDSRFNAHPRWTVHVSGPLTVTVTAWDDAGGFTKFLV